MNRFFVITLAASLILVSCATTSQSATPAAPQATAGPFATLDLRASDLNGQGYAAAVGLGESTNYALALEQAKIRGRAEVSKAIETKVEGLGKDFAESVGAAENAEINQKFDMVSKETTKSVLNGVTVDGVPLQYTELRKNTSGQEVKVIHVGVVMAVNPKVLNGSINTEIKNTDAKLYERFRASQAYEELQTEMDKYDAGK
jgi:hypothetical protein